MRLATAQQVLSAMSVGSATGTEAAANQALEMSYPIIESLLDTRFRQTDYVDYFDYGTMRSVYAKASPTTLWLSGRFISPEAIVVREVVDGVPLRQATDGVIVDPSDYFIDAENGEVSLLRSHTRGLSTISVAYRAGFGHTGGQIINDSRLPQWVVSGAITAAVHILNTHPATTANRKTSYAEEISRLLRSHLYGVFAPHFRSRVDRTHPSRSVATDAV